MQAALGGEGDRARAKSGPVSHDQVQVRRPDRPGPDVRDQLQEEGEDKRSEGPKKNSRNAVYDKISQRLLIFPSKY